MRNTLKTYLKAAERNRRYRTRSASVLLVLSLIVAADVFWGLRQTGLTLAGTAACGYEEHTHADACYQTTLICSLTDEPHTHSDACYTNPETGQLSDPVLICDLTEVPHEHTESCYVQNTETAAEPELVCTVTTDVHEHTKACYESVLVCEKEEHIHQITCYSDDTADVETQLDWQAMFDGMQTGNLRCDLIAVAESQLGYTESTLNFQVNDAGTRNGYTRYGAWYGAPYSDWSAMFVSFCLHYAGSDTADTPYNIGADAMLQLWNTAGRFAEADAYDPVAGDLIFFSDHTVGIVTSVSCDVLTVICGDVDNTVCKQTVMDYADAILGYGMLEPPSRSDALFAVSQTASAGFTAEACTCGNETLEAGSHADTCAYKTQLNTIAGDYSAEELYAIWDQIPDDAGAYILTYLTNNAWQYPGKAEELQALIDGGGSAGDGITATCGDASFRVTGSLPETAELHVTDPGYTEAQRISYVNPNIQNHVNWSMIYDISITDNGTVYTPTSPVTVEVTLPTLTDAQYNPDTMFFYAVHLDAVTGEELSRERVDVTDNTVSFTAAGFSPYMLYSINKESEGGERILGTNWMRLRETGYFTYWEKFLSVNTTVIEPPVLMTSGNAEKPSRVQIDDFGGKTVSEYGDGVEVSKTIDGTDLENVFDITLTVQTQQNISEVYKEPDMAVVIVMDISHTMNNKFGADGTRYTAAMAAAEKFLDRFAASTGDVSKIGYVAFNTSAHRIFDLSPCSTEEEALSLKNKMRQDTGTIINASDYKESHTRFTNVEAGLKMGYDMIKDAPNEHKYLIFLSDGFPTTYLNRNTTDDLYDGYDPYTPSGTKGADGVFYDYSMGEYCDYGTSYSDKAAIRAREQAEAIKEEGVTIFSIGVDVGGQTIAGYEVSADSGFSVIDRTGSTYEIGDATSTESYVNWLKNSIGSGYYYDSTNAEGLEDAYEDIFEKILEMKEAASKADWVAQDPLPLTPPEYLEFIGFYTKDEILQPTDTALSGLPGENKENSAVYAYSESSGLNTITWDLKQSGYTQTQSGDTTTYSYQLVYRVRLKNELGGFTENFIYDTNAPTSLTYRVFESTEGVITLSEQRSISFEIPAVHGFLSEYDFMKVDSYGKALAGAEFRLSHDTDACPICRGDGKTPVAIQDFTATSAADGTVSFSRVPSGHTYILQETLAPPGYISDKTKYQVVVAYDVWTVNHDGWTGEVVNKTGPAFPSTGGAGILPYILTGLVLISVPVVCEYHRRRKRERRRDA